MAVLADAQRKGTVLHTVGGSTAERPSAKAQKEGSILHTVVESTTKRQYLTSAEAQQNGSTLRTRGRKKHGRKVRGTVCTARQ